MEVYFIVAQPIGKTKKFKLSEGEYVLIGRSKDQCQVPLSDEMCSSKHCKVSLTNNCIFVEDAGSKNGIYLNGLKVLKQRFYLDDKLKIGDSVMYIHHEKLTDEDKAYLTYNGNTTRVQGGYTLELDTDEKSGKSYLPTHKQVIQKKYAEARKKAYTKHREDKHPQISKEKLQVLEMFALGLDLLIALLVFYLGLVSFKFINADQYKALAGKNLTDTQIFLHNDVSTWLFGAFIVAAGFFAINRTNKSGSIGEKALKIS